MKVRSLRELGIGEDLLKKQRRLDESLSGEVPCGTEGESMDDGGEQLLLRCPKMKDPMKHPSVVTRIAL